MNLSNAEMVLSVVYGMRLPFSSEKIHISSDSHCISGATCDGRRTRLRLPSARISALVKDRRPERESRSLESLELRVSSPLLCLRQFPPLSRLPEPKHVRSHRLSEPRDIPPSSPLPRTPRPTRPSAPDVFTWRGIE